MAEPHMPQTAEVAPDFELPDSTGERHRLSSLVENQSLVLIFYRGYW